MSSTPNATDTTDASLYRRLGGAEGISSLVDDIVDAHMKNPVIRSRFLPYRETPEKLEEVKRHLCEFIEEGSGGPGSYSGSSMPEAHRGMNINEAEYVAAVDDIMDVLEAHEVGEQTRKDMLAIVYSLKDEIVHC
ncbi:MAG: group I truncated hemoglobin [Longimicrobiales bacterium]